MSELVEGRPNSALRIQLLATASAFSLVASISTLDQARAEEAARPTVWLELGGQMEAIQGSSSPFLAPFITLTPVPEPYSQDSLVDTQNPPRNAFGLEGKITVQPTDSDWKFSAGIRYGRSGTKRHIHHQTNVYYSYLGSPHLKYIAQFADTKARYSESHAILDFSVGRDVGLGILGRNGNSTINAGIRYAQFATRSSFDIRARPVVNVVPPTPSYPYAFLPSFNQYTMIAHASRSFRGIGPSLSWSASAAVLGNEEAGEITFDLGLNASVLFGRQKAAVDHATQAHHATPYKYYPNLYAPRSNSSVRSRSVTIPNLGGFAGLSVKYPNAKVSLGYRTDFFFGAVDAGIDQRRTKNLGFSGPFATISIGLGG